MPTAARELQANGVGDAGLERALAPRADSSTAILAATASRTARNADDTVHGLLDELEPRRSERLDRAHRLLHAPRAVRVQAQRHLSARRRRAPPRRSRRRRRADLELHAGESRRRRFRGLRGRPRAVERGDRRVHGTRSAATGASAGQRSASGTPARRARSSHSATSIAASACGSAAARRQRRAGAQARVVLHLERHQPRARNSQ